MQTTKHPIDYTEAIAALVKKLSMERAAQLYDFARFLLDESYHTSDAEDDLTEEELAAEDAQWEAAMARHADKFASLKAQAKADVQARKTSPMFDRQGEFIVE